MCLAQGRNAEPPVMLEPANPRLSSQALNNWAIELPGADAQIHQSLRCSHSTL